MSSKILITGGAGCLGSNLIEHFFPKAYDICVIDNYETGKKRSFVRTRPFENC